ncbi:MAG: HAMP domain-containing histidine kinase [Candidatus Calescibacterium sp.]|nr:HAMP domain-containing histidine kinase [Candidatus Calescibacterium sp.]MCX7734653.1 HAMP domain-containing histidine kinase [bacterium]
MKMKKNDMAKLLGTGIMVPSIIHDIRGYLSVIKAHAQIGLKETSEEKAKERFVKIISKLESIEELIEVFRKFYREGKVVRTEIDFYSILDEVLSVLSQKLKGSINLVKDVENFKLRANKIMFRQVLVNLLSNAIEAVASSDEKTVGIASRKIGKKAYIWIFDTGCGIPRRYKSKLFSHSFTTKKDGTGLGLIITKNMVDAHGWKIKIIENPGVIQRKLNLNSNIKTAFEIEISDGVAL